MRFCCRAAILIGWIAAGTLQSFAQDTNAPPPLPPPVKVPSTNFMESPSAPAPAGPPGLSLHPQTGPQVETPDNGTAESFNLIGRPDEADTLADHLLVVYNQNDPSSKYLADYYAAQRNIPAERVLSISCSDKEEISRADYEKTIREPIFSYLVQKNWITRQSVNTHLGGRSLQLLVATRNDIWAIVLMRGVPLKIAPDPTDTDSLQLDPAMMTNAAAVDSELALLPIFGLPKGGFVPNIFFDIRGTNRHRPGSELAKRIILVTRLDGPTPEMVRRMIDDTIYAEKNRLAGLAVIDCRGIRDAKSNMIAGDVWLRNASGMLALDGWTLKVDEKPDVLPATDPCNQVAIYLGWYNDTAVGPWITPPDRFVRGAIAYHLHSFSAGTVRSMKDRWVGPLIAHGADATMGTVYEPYLGLTPREDVFVRHLLDGNYFAEAAYASIPGLSWMVTIVGDPLYRPFRVPLDDALAGISVPHTDHDDWLILQSVQRQLVDHRLLATTEALKQNLDGDGFGPVAAEGLAGLLEKAGDSQSANAVDQAYKKALAAYKLPIDRIRVGLKLAQYFTQHGQESRTRSQIDMLRQMFPDDAKRFGIITDQPGTPVASSPGVPSAPPVKPASPPAALPKPPRPPLPPVPTMTPVAQ